ncbi:uncharacterized protein LOC119083963 [Bradysia coprophila]|uniref:uncharacterized protein LOC119082956 n=1 Tax=Bradysia coprophila TaxID=38358 RepID=UPI00187DB44C|nr:uncharacterized protein LOC119082956 [Bradysia coprophila]XP_037048499.1 uncharacterized protein LOC119082956 [Bradysia coprophila]XP_037049664.1 uncharacterized protein LOC119083963 [Bradysia coprophila]
MSDNPSQANWIDEYTENQLLEEVTNYEEYPTPSLDQSIYNISSELDNLSVTITPTIGQATAPPVISQATAPPAISLSTVIPTDTPATTIETNKAPLSSTPKTESIKRRLEKSNSVPEAPIKKFKSIANMFPLAAAVAASESFVVDIIPNVDGVLTFTESQGKIIGNSITRALFSDESMASLHFESSGLDRGRYRLICTDTTTRDWVVAIVPKLEGLWQGANIRSVVSGPPPKLIRGTVIVQLPAPDPNDFFNIIATQNPTLDTSNWKIYSRSKAQNGKQQWIIGVEDCCISALNDLAFRPYCGMTRVRIVLNNNANNP